MRKKMYQIYSKMTNNNEIASKNKKCNKNRNDDIE